MIKVYFDGACEPCNPGGRCLGGVRIENKKSIYEDSFDYGHECWMTNNFAEHSALLSALQYLVDNRLNNKSIKVYGDSMLVINQMKGIFRINDSRPYSKPAKTSKELLKQFKKISFHWIPREMNERADSLSKVLVYA